MSPHLVHFFMLSLQSRGIWRAINLFSLQKITGGRAEGSKDLNLLPQAFKAIVSRQNLQSLGENLIYRVPKIYLVTESECNRSLCNS